MELTSTTTVTKPPQEVYDFWHRLENLATFMAHLDDVRVTGPSSSHWSASAPFDTVVEWDAVTTGDVAAERIAWASVGAPTSPPPARCCSCPHRAGGVPRCASRCATTCPPARWAEPLRSTSATSPPRRSTTTCGASSR
ncbi:SRPBCC family protein [Blastococcus brunescens]|uniref:SRPBCC family protein n=1 Tax=Blastococcus brunescens TaxID=1564165 RepID=A0ABZ1ATB7_9ACTN|nr:SRPBCC family protein [Blastococcus sp. BMG 8361]WRL61815.1 SRPBCC family protein [Blastococcus sp. BMG 8361]